MAVSELSNDLSGEALKSFRLIYRLLGFLEEGMWTDPIETHLRLGMILACLHEKERSKRHLLKVLECEPLHDIANLYLGKLFESEKDWANAKRYYANVVIRHRHSETAKMMLTKALVKEGKIFYRNEQFRKAEKNFKYVVDLNPNRKRDLKRWLKVIEKSNREDAMRRSEDTFCWNIFN